MSFVQPKQDWDTERHLNGPALLLPRNHPGKPLNDPVRFGLEVLIRPTEADVANASILLDGKHYGHPALDPQVNRISGIPEIPADMLLYHFIEAGTLVSSPLATGENGGLLNGDEGNFIIKW